MSNENSFPANSFSGGMGEVEDALMANEDYEIDEVTGMKKKQDEGEIEMSFEQLMQLLQMMQGGGGGGMMGGMGPGPMGPMGGM